MNLFSLAGWTWVWETINSLLLIICDWIYICIGWFYQVFTAVAKTNLFSREVFDKITSRLYIIVAMAMLFIFAYNIILMIIDPDKKQTTGNAGKLVKDTIISFVLVILLPTIFNYMYVFQNNVIESNVIQTIILGEDLGGTSGKSTNCDKDDFDCSCDFSGLRGLTDYTQKKRNAWLTAGKYILTGGLYGLVDIYSAFHNSNDDAAIFKALGDSCQLYRDDLTGAQRGAYSVGPTLLAAFYRPSSFTYEECVDYLLGNDSTPVDTDEEKDVCVNYFIDINMSRYTGNIGMFVGDQELIRVVSDSSKDIIEFNGFMALLAGGLAAWMFLCYAMEIGVRVAKLGVLQLISPIPVMMRIVPGKKESMFDKWLHQLINTYLDVFIRLIIIFFSLFAISLVPDVLDTLWASLGSSSNNAFIRILAGVVVILGILKFGQDAPGLLKEFFGGLGGGSFALRSPAKQIADNKVLQGGINKAKGFAGGATALATTKANQIKNFRKNWNNDTTFGGRARQISDLASMKAYKKGYELSKDAKSIDDWGYDVKKASVDTLKDKGFIYEAKQSFSEIKDELGNVINKNYSTQDTKALQSTADAMKLIADQAKLIIGKVEDDPKFKGIISQFDSAIDNANKQGKPELVAPLTKAKVDALAAMREALLKEKLQGKEAMVHYEFDSEGVTKAIVSNMDKATKGINRELKTAVDNLNSALGDNFEKFNAGLQDSEKELGIKFGEIMDDNKKTLQQSISDGNAKLIKNIKTVSDDMANAAKAEIINMEKKDSKK